MSERPDKLTEGRVVDGIYQPANACAECGKWIPPWKGGVPASVADAYCWGRHPTVETYPSNNSKAKTRGNGTRKRGAGPITNGSTGATT